MSRRTLGQASVLINCCERCPGVVHVTGADPARKCPRQHTCFTALICLVSTHVSRAKPSPSLAALCRRYNCLVYHVGLLTAFFRTFVVSNSGKPGNPAANSAMVAELTKAAEDGLQMVDEMQVICHFGVLDCCTARPRWWSPACTWFLNPRAYSPCRISKR